MRWVYRPTYSGTGVVTLESSLGGYHVMELQGESWILERGSYWASEGDVDVSFYRERLTTGLLAGQGVMYLQTKVRGRGKVVLTTRGPVKEMALAEGQSMVAQGPTVIARTRDVAFKMRRPTRNLLGFLTAGEGWVRVYRGPGRILVNPRPYWRYWILLERHGDLDLPSQLTF